jgi:predicted NAD/FAD-binding protein/DUF1365 family protein
MTRRIAVVGSGVSGLVAAYVLAKDSHVTVYEANDRLGGHADTHDVETADGHSVIRVDTGFIVHNERTYPTLLRLFDELGVPTQESDMSMSVVDQASGLEYAGALGRRGLFPTRANVGNPRYLRMLAEITRFHRQARKVLVSPSSTAGDPPDELTLAEFLEAGRYSAYFCKHFMTPLVACVWSCDPGVALDYPARYLFTFLEHHGMLTVFGSPTWRTVTGGSREYVTRVAAHLDDIRLGHKITAIAETADGVQVTDDSGTVTPYDAVVVATHPDQALALLTEATPLQHQVLSAFEFSANIAQLHTDTSLLPPSKNARASWNYQRRAEDDGRVLVTYDISRLMRLPTRAPVVEPAPVVELVETRYLVTLNGTDIVDPSRVIATREYAHPTYNPSSVAAQRRLPEINTDRIAFAGAWHGWGFHEDGALSGLKAAEHLGGRWPVRTRAVETPRIYRTTIGHARTAPVRNVFSYRSYTWLTDLDDLPRHRGLATFEAGDHIGDPNRTLRENIDAFLAGNGIDLGGGRVLMLSQARVLGYVFNPISLFWCYRADESLAGVVVEVHNTYGGRHAYLVHPDERGAARVGKELYVSPFNDVSGEYEVVAPLPGETLRVSVTLHREGQPPFVATMRGDRQLAGRTSLIRAVLRMPLAPLIAMARIKVQGIKLWARGLKIQPRPSNQEDAT